MHERHKRALNAVRKRFRAARNDLNLHINAYEVVRERCAREGQVGGEYPVYVTHRVKFAMNRLLDAIERYQEAGDILVTVERLLEKA